MRCPKCGRENKNKGKFCVYCGELLRKRKSSKLLIGGIFGFVIVLGSTCFFFSIKKTRDIQATRQEGYNETEEQFIEEAFDAETSEEEPGTKEIVSTEVIQEEPSGSEMSETQGKKGNEQIEIQENVIQLGEYRIDPNKLYYSQNKQLYCSNDGKYFGTGGTGGFYVIDSTEQIAMEVEGFFIIDCSAFQIYGNYLYYHVPYEAYRPDGQIKRIVLGNGEETAVTVLENAGENFYFQDNLCYFDTLYKHNDDGLDVETGTACLDLETGEVKTISYDSCLPDADYIVSISGSNVLYWKGTELWVRDLQSGSEMLSELLDQGKDILVGRGVYGVENGVFYGFQEPGQVQRMGYLSSVQYDGDFFYGINENNQLVYFSLENNGKIEVLNNQYTFFDCTAVSRDNESGEIYLLVNTDLNSMFCSVNIEDKALRVIAIMDMAG